MAERYGSEDEARGLNAQGNPEVQCRSEEGGRPGVGVIGQTYPGGVMARGIADKSLWSGRGGTPAGREHNPRVSGRR